jgi:flagellar assembly protein FliH
MSFVVKPRRRAKSGLSADLADAAVAIDVADDALDAEMQAEIAQQVQREVARLRAQAEAEGHAEGAEEGHRAAQAQAAAALESAVAALREAWTQLAAPLARKEHDLAELVTELSFALARHMVGVEVNANAESLETLVAQLIREAASERGPRQSIVVRLNPADHALLQPVTQIEEVHLLSDAAISRGGALVEIIAPDGDPVDKIEWDATIETRIASIQEALALHAPRDGGGSTA